jgi:hypothetical protein
MKGEDTCLPRAAPSVMASGQITWKAFLEIYAGIKASMPCDTCHVVVACRYHQLREHPNAGAFSHELSIIGLSDVSCADCSPFQKLPAL